MLPLLRSPYAFAGIGISRDGARRFDVSCAPGIGPATEATLFRSASISKLVTARTALRAAERAGVADPWHADVQDILGFPLRHPQFRQVPVTVRMLASHSAALDEGAGYGVPPDVPLADWIATAPGPFRTDTRPGSRFSYANLGYILLAAVAQVWGAAPFDGLARDLVLAPPGLHGGFNWSGVDARARATALPTYRRIGDTFVPQIDSAIPATGLILADRAVTPHPGNTAAFSPQGGLRLSLSGMLHLAETLATDPGPRLWHRTDGPGDYLAGLFQDYGAGVQFLDAAPFYPRPLTGHFANAYGFNGGIWWDAQARSAFAYALNGLPGGDESDALSPDETALFARFAELASDTP